MHSIESMRAIRNMELMFGNCHLDAGERYDRRPPIKSRENYRENHGGEVIAVLKYNLTTREITISKPDLKD